MRFLDFRLSEKSFLPVRSDYWEGNQILPTTLGLIGRQCKSAQGEEAGLGLLRVNDIYGYKSYLLMQFELTPYKFIVCAIFSKF